LAGAALRVLELFATRAWVLMVWRGFGRRRPAAALALTWLVRE
jgi:hypothetical protein